MNDKEIHRLKKELEKLKREMPKIIKLSTKLISDSSIPRKTRDKLFEQVNTLNKKHDFSEIIKEIKDIDSEFSECSDVLCEKIDFKNATKEDQEKMKNMLKEKKKELYSSDFDKLKEMLS